MGTKVDDASLLDGGPLDGGEIDGDKTIVPATGPKMVMVGGVEMPEDVAKYLTPLVEQFTGRIGELESALQRATAPAPASQKPASHESPEDDYDFNTKIFEEPAEALARLEKKIKQELKQELESKARVEADEKAFWSEFYKDNPELKEYDFIVKAVLQRDLAKLSTKSVDEAIKMIAAETKKHVLKNEPRKGNPDKVTLEGGGNVSKFQPEGEAPTDETFSVSSFLKGRREARRAARRPS